MLHHVLVKSRLGRALELLHLLPLADDPLDPGDPPPPPALAAAAVLGRLLAKLARLTSGINTWGGQWEVRLGEVSRRPHMDRHGLLFTFNVNIVSCD